LGRAAGDPGQEIQAARGLLPVQSTAEWVASGNLGRQPAPSALKWSTGGPNRRGSDLTFVDWNGSDPRGTQGHEVTRLQEHQGIRFRLQAV
jgi:hypothetical protein